MDARSSVSPSLEPYLRARAANPALIPSQPPRTVRTQRVQSAHGNEEFIVFLRKLARLATSPVTVPLHLIHKTLTSPMTVSLVLKLILLSFLTFGSAVLSILAVAAFLYSWGTGGQVELEGWLVYGSKAHQTPHALIDLPVSRFVEDLQYDVEIELELVRPVRGAEEMGNFMLSLELRSARSPEIVVVRAAQPSLPPPPLPSSLLHLPSLPVSLIPPCVLPWPFRFMCPARVFGYQSKRTSRRHSTGRKGGFASPAHGKDVVLLRKELMEGVVVHPGRGGEWVVGSAFVGIGREDSFGNPADGGAQCSSAGKEVRTTGWVVVRFVPRPTGIRRLLASHSLPPLLILPPVSLFLTLSSAMTAFAIISYVRRSRVPGSSKQVGAQSEEAILAEKRKATFAVRDREEKQEAARRQEEWQEVESSAMAGGGLRRMPEEAKRSRIGESTIGGSETTAPSYVRSFAPTLDTVDDSATDVTATEDTRTETGTVSEAGNTSRRQSQSDY